MSGKARSVVGSKKASWQAGRMNPSLSTNKLGNKQTNNKKLRTSKSLGGNARSVVGSKKASWQAERSTVIPAQPPPRQQTNKLKTNKHCGKKQTASMGGAQSCKMSQIWQIYLCKNIGKFG